MGKSPIFDEAKIVYSLTFDETEYLNDLKLLDNVMLLISLCKKRMNLATNNGITWSDITVLFGD